MSESPVILEVDAVSKKFCRALHRSLRYGVVDMCRELVGLGPIKSVRPGEFWAVQDLSLQLRRGESIALMGPNGAGKSTLIKIIQGLIRPDEGRVRVRARMAALTQLGAGFNPILSGRENVYINAAVLGFKKQFVDSRLEEMLDFSGMASAIDDPVRTYSSGMRARLGYSIAAFLNPELLLMDEVLATGDIAFRTKCFDHLEKLIAQGTSIIVVTHMMGRIGRACNRFAIMDQGKLYFDGSVDEGLKQYHQLMQVKLDASDTEDGLLSSGSSKRSRGSSQTAIKSSDMSLGAALIENVQVVNREGNPIDAVEHNEDVFIRFRIAAHDDASDLSFEMRIEADGDEVMVGYFPGLFSMKGGTSRELQISVTKWPMLRGQFQIRGTLLAGVPPHIISEKFSAFRVNPSSRPGLFVIPHRWTEILTVEAV